MILWKLDTMMRLRGIKGRDLARRLGIGENYLSRIRREAPDRFSLSLLNALCRELDCSLVDLLDYETDGIPEAPQGPLVVESIPPEPTLTTQTNASVLAKRLAALKNRKRL
jgi:DNA-binding Xre family transcriptional regulator